ncbi:MAG: type IX secretion system sortase PorU, partial [Bacteroidales bacterium]|nr:type IX secretion system sortase PorU [Bacteroidales bacterium]
MSDSFKIQSYYKIINHKRVAIISIPTLKTNILPSVVDKIISFDLEYEKQINPYYYDQKNNLNGKEFIFANKSAMRNGDWYQFKIKKNGVYKLTYGQITQAGININDINSSNIKMYGFGNMLKEANSALRDPDIPELAIKMEDGGDGSFDSGDYILFYAQGPDNWEYITDKKRFKHRLNIYSRSAYYYLVLSDGNGKRIEETSSVNNPNFTVNSFADYDVIEDEKYSLINSGRRWFGDKYEFTTNYDYMFSFKNISQNSKINLKAVFVARSERSSTFKITAFNETKRINISQIGNGSYPEYANNGSGDWEFNNTSASENIPITVEYSQPLSSSVGWLDFLEINVERDLIFVGSQMEFRDPKSIRLGRISKFNLQNPNGKSLEIWETTNHNTPSKIAYATQGNTIEFTLPTNDLREFISFDKSSSLSPEYVKKIENQNLHAELNHEYIIVSYPNFLEQAEELAQFHRENSGMDVYVTTLEPIYHEYSSGKQDVSAIRDFLRSVYLNSDENKKLKYVLFFGDASMDYLKREENNTNMVPTWESYESLEQIFSYATDDFFAFFDEDEGHNLTKDVVDIGTGRFPVATTAEAQQMVNKAKHYASNAPNVMADWRNVICFVADDEDGNLHLDQANDLSIIVDDIYPTANLDKIFVDAYQQESTSAGQRYPKVNQAINERVDKGALIISYTGHGGEVGWGQERFLDVPDIVSWTNYDKLPVFLTATCEFSRYDDPERVSAGELIFLNSKGGGISLFTTSRATFSSTNFTVSKHFYNIALTRKDGKYPRMGEIMKRTKQNSGGGLNVLKFILLGDPALHLNMPEYKLNISSVHNTITGNITDTIKALSSITIKGNITNENDQILSDFNGFVYPSIYDKPSEVTTLGNDGGSNPYTF